MPNVLASVSKIRTFENKNFLLLCSCNAIKRLAMSPVLKTSLEQKHPRFPFPDGSRQFKNFFAEIVILLRSSNKNSIVYERFSRMKVRSESVDVLTFCQLNEATVKSLRGLSHLYFFFHLKSDTLDLFRQYFTI